MTMRVKSVQNLAVEGEIGFARLVPSNYLLVDGIAARYARVGNQSVRWLQSYTYLFVISHAKYCAMGYIHPQRDEGTRMLPP